MFENARIFGKYLSGKTNVLEFRIPDLKITRVDSKDIRSKIMSIDPEKKRKSWESINPLCGISKKN